MLVAAVNNVQYEGKLWYEATLPNTELQILNPNTEYKILT